MLDLQRNCIEKAWGENQSFWKSFLLFFLLIGPLDTVSAYLIFEYLALTKLNSKGLFIPHVQLLYHASENVNNIIANYQWVIAEGANGTVHWIYLYPAAVDNVKKPDISKKLILVWSGYSLSPNNYKILFAYFQHGVKNSSTRTLCRSYFNFFELNSEIFNINY